MRLLKLSLVKTHHPKVIWSPEEQRYGGGDHVLSERGYAFPILKFTRFVSSFQHSSPPDLAPSTYLNVSRRPTTVTNAFDFDYVSPQSH